VKKTRFLIELRKEKENWESSRPGRWWNRKVHRGRRPEAFSKRRSVRKRWPSRKQTEHELAKIQLAAAEVRLKEKTIRAPLSGTVVKNTRKPAKPWMRRKALDVSNIDQVYVQFYLDPKLMQTIKPDARSTCAFR